MAITIEKLQRLKEPIKPQWKVQNIYSNKTKCACVPYIDARDVMRLLDEVIWPEERQEDYTSAWAIPICRIWIMIDGHWVWKWDAGNKDDNDKSVISWAFKRAAVKRGIGRFLYDIPSVHLDYEHPSNQKNWYPVDSQKKRIYDLSKHINDLLANRNSNAR